MFGIGACCLLTQNTVVDFAKQTGDYRSLSATDLKVLALVYMLEREENGIEHIRTEPPSSTYASAAHSLYVLIFFCAKTTETVAPNGKFIVKSYAPDAAGGE